MAVIRNEQGTSRIKDGEVFLLFVKNKGSFACVIKLWMCKSNKNSWINFENKYFSKFKTFCRIHKTKTTFSASGQGTLTAYSWKCFDYSEHSSEMKPDISHKIFKVILAYYWRRFLKQEEKVFTCNIADFFFIWSSQFKTNDSTRR